MTELAKCLENGASLSDLCEQGEQGHTWLWGIGRLLRAHGRWTSHVCTWQRMETRVCAEGWLEMRRGKIDVTLKKTGIWIWHFIWFQILRQAEILGRVWDFYNLCVHLEWMRHVRSLLWYSRSEKSMWIFFCLHKHSLFQDLLNSYYVSLGLGRGIMWSPDSWKWLTGWKVWESLCLVGMLA